MSSMDDFQQKLDWFMQEQNSRGLKEFEWYSPLEMQVMLYHPFSPISPVRLSFQAEEDYRRIPLLNQARYLMESIRQSGEVKLTANGFLPTSLVNDLYQQEFMKDYFVDKYKTNKTLKEGDSFSVHMTRILLDVAGLTKKRKGHLSLTKKGQDHYNDPSRLLFCLMYAISHSFDWAYFDGYGQNNIGQLGWAFSIVLLAQYGREERSDTFYAEKHFNAFPAMIQEIVPPYIRDQTYTAYRCYSVRMLQHFLQNLGIIEIHFNTIFDDQKMVTTTDLLWKLFEIGPPNKVKEMN